MRYRALVVAAVMKRDSCGLVKGGFDVYCDWQKANGGIFEVSDRVYDGASVGPSVSNPVADDAARVDFERRLFGGRKQPDLCGCHPTPDCTILMAPSAQRDSILTRGSELMQTWFGFYAVTAGA